ncbi:MAG TPA: hypothetical protein VF791_15570 [Pyrinomonadaceae bacterium]
MFKRFTSLALAITLISTLGGTSAFANPPSDPETKTDAAKTKPATTVPATTSEIKPNEKLRAEIFKLVADARAGKVTPASSMQIQPRQSNSLSKSVKIGLIVGVAVAVVLVLIFIHERNNFFDCQSRCVL